MSLISIILSTLTFSAHAGTFEEDLNYFKSHQHELCSRDEKIGIYRSLPSELFQATVYILPDSTKVETLRLWYQLEDRPVSGGDLFDLKFEDRIISNVKHIEPSAFAVEIWPPLVDVKNQFRLEIYNFPVVDLPVTVMVQYTEYESNIKKDPCL